VVAYFTFVAREVRELMAQLGFRTFDEMVGRVDMLDVRAAVDHWKARGVDVSPLLQKPAVPDAIPIRCIQPQDHGLEEAIDYHLIDRCQDALAGKGKVEFSFPIRNANRTVGTMLSGEVAKRFGEEGLQDDTIRINFEGSAGQSFGAFLARGLTLTLAGDANDYLGKGLSGGRIVVYPPAGSTFAPHENIIAGNTLLYGATSGEVFLRGVVGERFGVRNSGAKAVVEGTGDHGCEYMTGGTVVILGNTGRNFAAGMSGGVAYVWDKDGDLDQRVNRGGGSIQLEVVIEPADIEALQDLIRRHHALTGSTRAREVLDNWDKTLPQFVKVVSNEYKALLAEAARQQEQEQAEKTAV
jgi:glutamate synthase domain-containing protein 3